MCAIAQRCSSVISGHDAMDATSAEAPVPDYAAGLAHTDLKGKRLGLPREYLKHATGETARLIEQAADRCRALGAEVIEISLPATDYAIDCYYILATAEASSNLARYDGVRYTERSRDSDTLSAHVHSHAR